MYTPPVREATVRPFRSHLSFLRSVRRFLAMVVLPAAFAAGGPSISAVAEPRPQIGDPVGMLTFKDIRYLPRSLHELSSDGDPVPKRGFVLVFTNTSCPLVEKYLPRLKQLDETYGPQGVQFVAVNVGIGDSIRAMASQAVVHDVPFPFVKDIDGNCVRACGVRRTPEVVLIDSEHRIRYRGRIDNRYRLGGTATRATQNELRDAIDALLDGREIAVTETPVDGCLITMPPTAPPAGNYTFSAHISPLMKKHCQVCHQPGTAAPFPLITYDDVVSNAGMIAEVVAERRMPPWFASDEFGTFTNERNMPRRERNMLLDWIRSGMPPGEPQENSSPDDNEGAPDRHANQKATVVSQSSDPWADRKWQMGQPDLILTAPFTYDVPADGYVDYKYAILPKLFLSDTWIQSAEIQPDNPDVVHHCNMGYAALGTGAMDAKLLTGYVPGGGPMVLDHGVAAKIPTGSVLGLQIHLTTTGKREKCRLRVGFRFPRDKVQKQLHLLQITNHGFAIAPHDPHFRVSRSRTLHHDATLYGYFVHMHLRGKDMTFRAYPPGSDPQTLMLVPNYSFDWQLPYYLPYGEVKFPAGTRFECVAHFDNSTFNPYNPDPAATVHHGQQTYDEMMYGFVFYTKDAEQLDLEVDPKSGRRVQ